MRVQPSKVRPIGENRVAVSQSGTLREPGSIQKLLREQIRGSGWQTVGAARDLRERRRRREGPRGEAVGAESLPHLRDWRVEQRPPLVGSNHPRTRWARVQLLREPRQILCRGSRNRCSLFRPGRGGVGRWVWLAAVQPLPRQHKQTLRRRGRLTHQ